MYDDESISGVFRISFLSSMVVKDDSFLYRISIKKITHLLSRIKKKNLITSCTRFDYNFDNFVRDPVSTQRNDSRFSSRREIESKNEPMERDEDVE